MPFEDDISNLIKIEPGEGLNVVTAEKTTPDVNIIVKNKINLGNPDDRVWLIEQISMQDNLPFRAEELRPILDFISEILDKEWLTIYSGGLISLHTGVKTLRQLYLFNHLIPLGYGLALLKDRDGFTKLIKKLNLPSYDRLSTLLEAFSAARYVAAGYRVELEPKMRDEKTPDFRVRLGDEWIYFECKRINVRENLSVRKNLDFVTNLQDHIMGFKKQISNDYRVEIRLGKKPTPNQVEMLVKDIKQMISNGIYKVWKEREYGKYALMPRSVTEKPAEYRTRFMQITVGTTPTPLSETQTPVIIYLNPLGSKIEQKFRSILKRARKQIPSKSRGILIIQGLDEERGKEILQERLGLPSYQNIVAGVTMQNGANAVRRDDHADVDFPFIGTCVSQSLFYGYDLRNY